MVENPRLVETFDLDDLRNEVRYKNAPIGKTIQEGRVGGIRRRSQSTAVLPGGGVLLDQISDFTGGLLNPGAGNYRITEQSNAATGGHGPGFRFICDFPSGSGDGVQIIDTDGLIDQQNYLNQTFDLSGWIMFPTAGNTSGTFGTGFPNYGDWNALWEYGPGFSWNNQWGVVGPTRQIYVRSYLQGAPSDRQKATGPTFALGTWYQWRWVVKSSTTSTGHVEFWWNGTQIANWNGPTQPTSNPAPWLQWGFYSADVVNNEVWYSDVRLQ